jgi:hypothetical protein
MSEPTALLLPGFPPASAEEAPCRSVIAQQGQSNRFSRSFRDGLRTAVIIQVGGSEAGISRIDFDSRVGQLRSQLDRQHIQGGLGGAVAQELERCIFPPWVGIERQGSEAARYIDDAAGGRFTQQWQHGLGYRERTDEIGVENQAHGIDTGLARWAIGTVRDRCIIYQDVEATEFSIDAGRRSLNCFGTAKINVNESNVKAFCLQSGRGVSTPLQIASTKQDPVVRFADLTGDFKADSLVGPCNEGDPVFPVLHCVFPLPVRPGSLAKHDKSTPTLDGHST